MYSNLEYVDSPTSKNFSKDVQLSLAIGGATSTFVCTDMIYHPTENMLINIVGIKQGIPDLEGCAIAGLSTSIGFLGVQTIANVGVKKGESWAD